MPKQLVIINDFAFDVRHNLYMHTYLCQNNL